MMWGVGLKLSNWRSRPGSYISFLNHVVQDQGNHFTVRTVFKTSGLVFWCEGLG